ncbi:MAG: RidA family protein [Candidatus Micrarchaeota archaeon]|nr:RidA family protein [Candidatus Micrarchaeota archaeon]
MTKHIIKAEGSFPISKAVLHNCKYTLELSGQIGVAHITDKLADGIENQTRIALENIKSILKEIKWELSNVVKIRVYLSDMKNYEKMNEIYAEYFTKNYPARVAMAVKELPRQALVEIECTAAGDRAVGE